METILKYSISPSPIRESGNNTYSISLPLGHEILSVQKQNNKICIFALVDTNHPCSDETFVIYQSGDEISLIGGKYIGTVIMDFGPALHVFKASI